MYVNAKSTLLHSQLHGNGWNVLENLWMDIGVLFLYLRVCVYIGGLLSERTSVALLRITKEVRMFGILQFIHVKAHLKSMRVRDYRLRKFRRPNPFFIWRSVRCQYWHLPHIQAQVRKYAMEYSPKHQIIHIVIIGVAFFSLSLSQAFHRYFIDVYFSMLNVIRWRYIVLIRVWFRLFTYIFIFISPPRMAAAERMLPAEIWVLDIILTLIIARFVQRFIQSSEIDFAHLSTPKHTDSITHTQTRARSHQCA